MRADSLDMLNTLAPKLLRLGVFFLVLTGVWTLSTFLGFRNVKFQITDFVFVLYPLLLLFPKMQVLSVFAFIIFTSMWISELNHYYFGDLIDWQIVRLVCVPLVLVFWMYVFFSNRKSASAKNIRKF